MFCSIEADPNASRYLAIPELTFSRWLRNIVLAKIAGSIVNGFLASADLVLSIAISFTLSGAL